MFLTDGGAGYDPGKASHAILLELRRTLEQYPPVSSAHGEPAEQFTRVRANIDPRRLEGDVDAGILEIRWYAGETQDAPPEFAIHYSDSSGFDCGWHHEPNPHVDEWGHYQERDTADQGYSYRPIEFASKQPVRILWEVLERLQTMLRSRQ